jgi:hypothetical protein
MFMFIYIDDIIVVNSNNDVVTTLLQNLQMDFALKDIELFTLFFGIEVNKVLRGCKSINTPMSTSEKLALHEGEQLGPNDSTQYRSIVGALVYLMLTGRDISFAINKVYQFLHSPIMIHLKQILQYLKACTKLGIKIYKSNFVLVSAFRLDRLPG